jgi:hypothetical protein
MGDGVGKAWERALPVRTRGDGASALCKQGFVELDRG